MLEIRDPKLQRVARRALRRHQRRVDFQSRVVDWCLLFALATWEFAAKLRANPLVRGLFVGIVAIVLGNLVLDWIR